MCLESAAPSHFVDTSRDHAQWELLSDAISQEQMNTFKALLGTFVALE
jgi:hypothetical protein